MNLNELITIKLKTMIDKKSKQTLTIGKYKLALYLIEDIV